MRRVLLNRYKGITFVETMIVACVLAVIMAGLFYALTSGQSSQAFNAAEIQVQSEVRRAVEWVSRDVRQARRVNIGASSNNPLSTHIKFNKVTGYDTSGGGALTLSSNYIEYTYDSTAQTLTRSDSSTTKTWVFNNIIQAPFYTNNGGSIIPIDPPSPGQDSPMFTTGNLVIIMAGQKEVKSGLNATYTLTEEVKIRN